MFVPGVTPGKWERIWPDRMPRQPLDLRPASETEALAALHGPAHMAFLRDVPASDDLHVIPLYREQPVVSPHATRRRGARRVTWPTRWENVVEGQDAATSS